MQIVRALLLAWFLASSPLAAPAAFAQTEAQDAVPRPLPHNLQLESALLNEHYSFDRNIAHINENQRGTELSFRRTLQDIQADWRLDGDQKALRIAEANDRYTNDMKRLERQRALAQEQHARELARIREEHGARAPAMKVDQFNIITDPLEKNRLLAAAEGEHDKALTHIAQNRRMTEVNHKRRLADIQTDRRLASDVKAKEVDDENEIFQVQLRHLDRQNALAEKRHENQVAEIEARFSPSQPRPPLLKGRIVENVGQESPDATGGLPAEEKALAERLNDVADDMGRAAKGLGANMDHAADRFMQGAADMIGQQAGFMAQKPGEPLKQMTQAVVDYLVADHNENDKKLYDAAAAAVESFQKDPAYFLGSNIDSLLPGGKAAGAGRAAARTAHAVEDVVRLEKAAKTVRQVEKATEEFSDIEFGAGPAAAGRGIPRLNPQCGDKNCVPVAISQAKRFDTRGQFYEPIDPTPRGLTSKEARQLLKEFFGDNPPAYRDPMRRVAHRMGKPVEMAKNQLEREMLDAGSGSHGIVFVKWPAGGGHAFNVRNVNGKVIYWDSQSEIDGAFHFDTAKHIFLYRVR